MTRRSARRRRAFTLVEALVVLALVTFFGGMLFRVATAAFAQTRRLEARNRLVAEAQLWRQRLREAFDRCAPELTASGRDAEWNGRTVAFPVIDRESSTTIRTVTIGNAGVAGSEMESERRRIRFVSAADEVVESSPDWEASIVFEFARAFDGVRPRWTRTIPPPAAPPRLIRTTVELRSQLWPEMVLTFRDVFEICGSEIGE